MRTNFFLLIILSISLSACSVETVMELEDNLNVILLETVDLPEKHVGDTMVFKVFAGTNDVLTRMSVTNATHDFSSMILGDGVYFEIVEDTLYTDAAGYFNRPVSSVVVNYPILIGRELLSQIAGLDFTFYTNNGEVASAHAQVKVVNYKLFPEVKDVYGVEIWDDAEEKMTFAGLPCYASALHQSYAFNFLTAESTAEIKGEALVDYIDMFQYQQVSGTDTVNYLYSPDRQEVQKLADRYNIAYNAGGMRHTLFLQLPEDFDFDEAMDEEIDALNFSNASDMLVMDYECCLAFLTEDGYKGIIRLSRYERTDAPVTPLFEVKRQTVATGDN